MRDLLAADAGQVLEGLRRPGALLVFDYDGTLAPIVVDRTRARLSPRTARLLSALATTRPVAVLSGRSVDDLAQRMEGVPVRWLVGGHGAEWPGEDAPRALVRRVAGWHKTLAARLARIDGIDIEDKARSLSVHWRAARDPARAEAAVGRAARGLPGATLVGGKRVLNVVPAGAPDKGGALARLAAESRCEQLLFVGDDVTDEAGFRARLPVPAIMVRVGRARGSAAPWYVGTRADVDRLVARLVGTPTPATARNGAGGLAASPDDRLGPALAFMRTLLALERGLDLRSREVKRRLGVTAAQRLVIRVVSRLSPISPGVLAQVLHQHPATATRLTRTLERRRMLHRLRDPHDRRRLLLELGPAGERLDRPASGTIESAITEVFSDLTAHEQAAARHLLERLTDRLLG